MRRLTHCFIVLAFAAATAHLGWMTFGNALNRDNRVGGDVSVLRATDRTAKNLYLRQTVWFREPPKSAWIQAIGRGKVEIFANGHFLGHEKSDVSPVAVIADLTPHLVEGKNVVAVVCRQEMRDTPPEVNIQGEYLVSGETIPLEKMGPWRQKTVFDRKVDYWFGIDYDDRDWPLAERAAAHLTATLSVPPRAYSERTRGAWISPASMTAKRLGVGLDFEVPEEIESAWLRLQSNCGCRVALNSVVVDDGDRYLAVNNEAAPITQWMYDISPFVHKGGNAIRMQVNSAAATPQFLADLECKGRSGKSYWFSTDPRWRSWPLDHVSWLDPIPANAPACKAAVGSLFDLPNDQVRKVVEIELPWSYYIRQIGIEVAAALVLALAVSAFVALLDVVFRWLAGPTSWRDVSPAFLALLPTALLFAAAILCTFDPRFSPQWVYRPWFFAVGLALVPLQWLALLVFVAPRPETPQLPASTGNRRQRWAIGLTLAVVFCLGAYLRTRDIATRPLSSDEALAYQTALNFWEYGFPCLKVSDDMPLVYVATSELLHIANSMVVPFTKNDRLIVRVDPAVCGMVTILLLYFFTRKLFNAWAGLLAAALYAVSPVCINMAQWGRYCSQLQMFTFMTAYFFFLAIEPKGRMNNRALWLAVISFIGMFLSWEGSVLIAIPMMAAALLHRRGDLRPMFGDIHVWFGIVLVGTLILAQMAHRTFVQIERPFYGTGASDVQLTPMWRYPDFDLWYFVRAASWNRDTLLPFLALSTALLLVVRHPYAKAARAMFIILLGAAFLEGLLMPIKAVRYAYHLLPLWLMLSGAGISALAGDLIARHAAWKASRPLQLYARFVAACGVLLFAVLSSGWTVDLARLIDWRIPGTRLGAFIFPGQKETALYVKQHWQPGDVVITNTPHLIDLYLDHPSDYWLETQLFLQATLDDVRSVPLHKYKGTQMINNLDDLRHVFGKARRVWFISEPIFNDKSNTSSVSEYIRSNMDVMFEDYRAVVMLRTHHPALIRQDSEISLERSTAEILK